MKKTARRTRRFGFCVGCDKLVLLAGEVVASRREEQIIGTGYTKDVHIVVGIPETNRPRALRRWERWFAPGDEAVQLAVRVFDARQRCRHARLRFVLQAVLCFDDRVEIICWIGKDTGSAWLAEFPSRPPCHCVVLLFSVRLLKGS